jgi:hypothetical protein
MKKRILVLLSVVALMVVMLAMSVAPALAVRPSPEDIYAFACYKSSGYAHPFGFGCA